MAGVYTISLALLRFWVNVSFVSGYIMYSTYNEFALFILREGVTCMQSALFHPTTLHSSI